MEVLNYCPITFIHQNLELVLLWIVLGLLGIVGYHLVN